MKIAITGTHSTGKTELAYACGSSLGLPIVRGDTIRQIMQANFSDRKLEELTSEEYWALENLGLNSRILAEAGEKNFISDGCTLNSIAYALAECGSGVEQKAEYPKFQRTALLNAKTYDLIIYLPPEIPLQEDGFRPSSNEFRDKVDHLIGEILEDFNHFTVIGSVERRVGQIRGLVGVDSKNKWDNYIAFEGLPRAGKTTQIKLLVEYAKRTGRNIYFAQRLKNKLAEDIKKLRNSNPYGNALVIAEMFCELQLQEFRENCVEERISEGQIVVTDRQKFSTLAMCRSLGVPLAELYKLTYRIPPPGQIIYLRVPSQVAINRAVVTNKEYTLTKKLEYIAAVCDQFDFLGRVHRFTVVDGEKPIPEVHKKIVQSIFEGRNG